MKCHCEEAAEDGITQEDNSCPETGEEVNRNSLSSCLDDDSGACIDGTGLSNRLYVKFSVACLNRFLGAGDILLHTIVN